MRRAIAALRTLAVVVSLAAACVSITAAPVLAAGPPKTGRIAFSDFITNQIYAVNPDGSGLVRLTHEPTGMAARWPDWSPGGSHLLFVRFNLSNGMGRIWVMNANGTGRRQLVSDAPGYRDYQPRYAPDGRHIVFSRCSPGDGLCAIWIMRSDGTRRHLVIPFIEAPNETNNGNPAVSPDGRRIAFTRFGFNGINAQDWVASIGGRHARPLTAPRLEASAPNWSPTGSHITFTSNTDRPQSSVYVMRANGTEVTKLATSRWPTNNFGSAYSPGGGQIAFSSDRRHPDLCCEELFVMRADGTRQHLVNTGIEGVVDVAWGSAPLVQARSPGTISRPAAGTHTPGAVRDGRCREAQPWLTGTWCGATDARVP